MLAPALCDYDVSGRQLSLVNFSLVEAMAWQPVTVPDTRAMLCQKDLMAEVKLVSEETTSSTRRGRDSMSQASTRGRRGSRVGTVAGCVRPSG